MYRMRRDGRAIVIRIRAGRMVQIVSISWAFMVLVWVSLVVSIREIVYRTSELTKKIIIRAWSWKAISSSMMGDVAFCRPNWAGVAIKIYR